MFSQSPTTIIVWRSRAGRQFTTRTYRAHANAFCADVRSIGGVILHTYQEG